MKRDRGKYRERETQRKNRERERDNLCVREVNREGDKDR